jgi:hypothetical protein
VARLSINSLWCTGFKIVRWREKECQNFGAPDKTAIKFLIWTGDDTSHANDTYFDPAMVLAANAFVANSLAEVRYRRMSSFFHSLKSRMVLFYLAIDCELVHNKMVVNED